MFYIEFLEIAKNKIKNIDTKKYKSLIEAEKKIYKQNNDENTLLYIWFCLSIIEAIDIYKFAFSLLKKRDYHNGWNELAQVERIINEIKQNINDFTDYKVVVFLDQYTRKLQKIFPYKAFTSVVLVNTKEECTICGKSMNPFNGCEHIRGKVYAGEMCYATVTEGDFCGLDFVEKPANKCSVAFEGLDIPENYSLLEYLIPKLENEYNSWDYKIETEYEPIVNSKTGRNEKCPCKSGKKFKHCCINKKGIKQERIKFLLPDNLLKDNY